MSYRYGNLSYYEHRGDWRSSPGEGLVGTREYEEVYLSLRQWLRARFAGHPRADEGYPCYIVGDYRPERTQQLEIYELEILTPDFVRDIQAELRRRGWTRWRILVSASMPEDIIIIYPGAICGTWRLGEDETDATIVATAARMDRRRREVEESRRERFDRARAMLPDAIRRALDRPLELLLVHKEKGWYDLSEVWWLWILHPRTDDYYDLREYAKFPTAYTAEVFYVREDGSLVDRNERKPADGWIVCAWQFEEAPDRVFVMERNGRRFEFPY
ncbi:MAG: hypothetical protein AABZ12_08550 [Planctomycetota bacterium]